MAEGKEQRGEEGEVVGEIEMSEIMNRVDYPRKLRRARNAPT